MMKETNFGPLLLLLLLAVTPRNSCANPIESPGYTAGGAPADMSSVITDDIMMGNIENDMKEGADILTKAMTWLKDNAINSIFDESILDLERKINLLPQRLAEYRAEILEGLYNSQDRLCELRILLETAAEILKDHCVTLIEMYEDPLEVSDLEQIRYSANKFVKFAKDVNDILEDALAKTIEINDELSASKAFLNDFRAVLDEEKNDIEAGQVAAGDIQKLKIKLDNQQQNIDTMVKDDEQYTDKIILLLCTFGLNLHCTKIIIFTNTKMQEATVAERINVPEGQMDDKTKLQEGIDMLNGIKTAHKSATTLLSNVEIVKTYLREEINLITIWRAHLNVATSENTNISRLDIKYNIKGIKKSLNVLKEACVDYLNHGTPDIFKTRVSKITPVK